MRNESLKKEPVQPEYFRGFVSKSMQQLEECVNRVAPANEALLITGESGTGKTELAKLIHIDELKYLESSKMIQKKIGLFQPCMSFQISFLNTVKDDYLIL